MDWNEDGYESQLLTQARGEEIGLHLAEIVA
jgi:hypothetical protein